MTRSARRAGVQQRRTLGKTVFNSGKCCQGWRVGLRAVQPPLCPASKSAGGVRGVAGRGDERPAAAGPDSAVRLFGAIPHCGMAAAGGSAPGRQPATAHVQPRLTHDNLLLHMQYELGQYNRLAVGNVLRTMTQSSSCLAILGFGRNPVGIAEQASAPFQRERILNSLVTA